MEIEEMVDFLETDVLSFIFSPTGLKYLSLRDKPGLDHINLGIADEEQAQNPAKKLIIEETLNFLETGKHSMPLDLADFTEFQQRVFEAVGNVEPGKGTTYGGIAKVLGKPGAARAVGSAVAKNPVSYFLPTHRVLPQKGIGICRTGAGYLREKLLEWEGQDLSKLRGNYVCTRKKCCQE